MIVSFIEGLANKMYEQSFYKEHLNLSKKIEYHNYNLAYEMIQNAFRTFVVLILYIFIKDIKLMIYIVLLFISTSLMVNFKTNIKEKGEEYGNNWFYK